MIDIISEEGDKTTNNIIEWILYYKNVVNRINFENFQDFTIVLGNKKYESNLKTVYHRRAKINAIPINNSFEKYIKFLKEDEDICNKAIEKIHKDNMFYVGGYNEEQQHNKLLDLHIAKMVGFNIPSTLITNKKKDLFDFYNICNKKIITKPIKNSLFIQDENHLEFGEHTFIITNEEGEILDSIFNLGLFQEYIQKKFEIRVFVFSEKIYSMAIFSQNNVNTQVDYRNYDHEKPNRCVPYNLPNTIKRKIFKFMKYKKIDTGSIDIIFSTNNKYFFLENNPQGQFDWLSKNCNYNIEKEIAEILISQI